VKRRFFFRLSSCRETDSLGNPILGLVFRTDLAAYVVRSGGLEPIQSYIDREMGREATNGDGAGNGNGHSDAIVAAVAEPWGSETVYVASGGHLEPYKVWEAREMKKLGVERQPVNGDDINRNGNEPQAQAGDAAEEEKAFRDLLKGLGRVPLN
jgi:hypothetical protein